MRPAFVTLSLKLQSLATRGARGNMSRALAIGDLARETGVKVPTIRYYESVDLLPAPPRSVGNRRQYDDAAVRRLKFVRHARELGFEIDAIRELLALAEQPQRSCAKVDALARDHLQAITSRIERPK